MPLTPYKFQTRNHLTIYSTPFSIILVTLVTWLHYLDVTVLIQALHGQVWLRHALNEIIGSDRVNKGVVSDTVNFSFISVEDGSVMH